MICTGSRDFATLMFECSQNGQSITEGCKSCQTIYRELTTITSVCSGTDCNYKGLFSVGGAFPLLVSYVGLTGGQLISITATGTDGARFTSSITFNIPSKPHLHYCKSLHSVCVNFISLQQQGLSLLLRLH